MPSTNTAGWLARRADEMPREAAVAASIIATCCLVSFSYVLSGEPAASFRPIAWTAPGEAASRLTFWEAVAESASEPVKFAPGGSVTGHQTPAATTPLMWSATASAPAGKPIGGLVLGAATLLAGPLSSTVNVVSSRTVNWREIWPAPVAVRPSTATNAPTPRIVPSMVSTALPGRCTMPDPGQSREPVDLTAVVTGCADRVRVAHPARTWHVRIADDLAAVGDEELLRRAIDNLLMNVLVHTPGETVGMISAAQVGDRVIVEVSDDGPGLPPDKLPHIFERFYRAGTRSFCPGAGLGLAIAAEITSAHGGTAQAAAFSPHGLRITLTLPAGQPPEPRPVPALSASVS